MASLLPQGADPMEKRGHASLQECIQRISDSGHSPPRSGCLAQEAALRMHWLSAISEAPTLEAAVDECVGHIASIFEDERPDIAIAFVGPGYESDHTRLPSLLDPLRARCTLACSSGGVIGA